MLHFPLKLILQLATNILIEVICKSMLRICCFSHRGNMHSLLDDSASPKVWSFTLISLTLLLPVFCLSYGTLLEDLQLLVILSSKTGGQNSNFNVVLQC